MGKKKKKQWNFFAHHEKKIEFDLTSNCKTTIKRSSIRDFFAKRAGGGRPSSIHKTWTYGTGWIVLFGWGWRRKVFIGVCLLSDFPFPLLVVLRS